MKERKERAEARGGVVGGGGEGRGKGPEGKRTREDGGEGKGGDRGESCTKISFIMYMRCIQIGHIFEEDF